MEILTDGKVLRNVVVGTAIATIGLTKLVKAEIKLITKVVKQAIEIEDLKSELEVLNVNHN